MMTDESNVLVERLQKENQRLASQVKRLTQTENELHKSKELLDGQVRLYRRLYEVGKRFNATFDQQEVLRLTTQFVITDLNFERCLVFLHEPESKTLRVVAFDGYYDPDLSQAMTNLTMFVDDPVLATLLAGGEYVLYDQDSDREDLYTLGQSWGMDEYIALSLGSVSSSTGMGLVIAGNTAERANYLTEVEADSEVVLGLANLVSQVATAINNVTFYHALEEERRSLEQKVAERTVELASAKEEIEAFNVLLKAENRRMSSELDVTRRLQKMILPRDEELTNVADLEIAGYMNPADEVGGDYYDVLQQDGRVKIGIGDVTGHGLESGILMTMVQMAVRTLLASNEVDLTRFLTIINKAVYANVQRMQSDKNLTLALLDYADGVLRVSGQHEEVIIVRADGIVEQIDTINLGFPIGLTDDISDFVGSTDLVVNRGDVVILYTDGIPEAENVQRQLYGIERLIAVVRDNRQKTATEIQQLIIADVERYIGDQKVYDDITLLVLKRK